MFSEHVKCICLSCFVLSVLLTDSSGLQFKYHSNSEIEEFLKNFTKNSPELAKLYSVGITAKNNTLWVLKITAVKKKRPGIPNIKLIGNIHGNEAVGREMLLHFLEYLRDNYKTDRNISWLLKNTIIHVMPTLNPDGFSVANQGICEGEIGRGNKMEDVDLNRNFPDYFRGTKNDTEPETMAVMKWMNETPFILSAALHGGALVANYPFDGVKEETSYPENQESLTPDDDVFKHLASVYSQNHLTMHEGKPCEIGGDKFEGGITNGAKWYHLFGGMQDFNYVRHGCMEITLEISCCKYPYADELPKFWEENRNALLQYCLQALGGVTGHILDEVTRRPVKDASLKILGRKMTFSSTKTGEFWRLLLPGKYQLQVIADGYYTKTIPFTVQQKSPKQLVFLKIDLLSTSYSTTTENLKFNSTKTRTTPIGPFISNRNGIIDDEFESNTAISAKQIREANYVHSRDSSSVFRCSYFNLSLFLVLRYVLL